MRITVVTLFPEMFAGFTKATILGRAITDGIVEIELVNPREFALNKHHTVDDQPFGGGPGMVMQVDVLKNCLDSLGTRQETQRILLSPRGVPFSQKIATELSRQPHLVFVCGRYEGVDARIESYLDLELSIGDFVMQGGEVGAMAIIEAVTRLIPGVLGKLESAESESFSSHLLEHAHFTRPREFDGSEVPEVLLSGNHQKIAAWREQDATVATLQRRPKLFARHLAASKTGEALAGKLHIALAHHPVKDRAGEVITTSVTNLDLHDMVRMARSYDLAKVWVISPIKAQRDKVLHMAKKWNQELSTHDRARGWQNLEVVSSIEEMKTMLGQPALIGTSAAGGREGMVNASDIWKIIASKETVLLFGSGWGLTETALAGCDYVMNPILNESQYNHLSVRTAMAVVLDRVVGPLVDSYHPMTQSP